MVPTVVRSVAQTLWFGGSGNTLAPSIETSKNWILIMKRLLLIAFLVVAPLAFAAQETRELPEFRSITSQGVYTLVVTAGQKQAFVVTGDKALLDTLTTRVVGNELVISMPHGGSHNWDDKITISIAVAHLSRFQIEGVGDTTLSGLTGETFELDYQGVGKLTAAGKVQKFTLKAKGVGAIDARDLDAQSVEATLEGVGSVSVRASKLLNAKVQGIGSLTYYGKPAQVTKSVDGIGGVRAAE